MLIHLMQHGVCLSKELDATQPLSPVGGEQIEKSATAARVLGLRFELIVASPKVRSLQIGRASWRERVFRAVLFFVVSRAFTKK